VKNNIDALPRQVRGRSPLLFRSFRPHRTAFIDPMTSSDPCGCVPATSTRRRLGIMLQAQLDDKTASKLIVPPFKDAGLEAQRPLSPR